ncbi:MAG TPA: carbonic anhydrase family protein [Rhodocyclaceae bacterium]|nr:carbonic anhydrase family protein [Rhodocyclaceae bacterium]
MKRSTFLALLLASGAVLAGNHGPHWGYSGHEGPEHWGKLDKSFAACKSGKEQSPVNIVSRAAKQEKLAAIEFHYQAAKAELVNNGHTVQINYGPGSYIVAPTGRYELLQFHFHTPSEEEIDGRAADMVAHLVHKNAAGQLAVVAVLFDRSGSRDNPALASFWDKLPKAGDKVALDGMVDAAALLPQARGYYHFKGSLTTPPCYEGVQWHVLKTPVSVGSTQWLRMRQLFGDNARPVQPVNRRSIVDVAL